MSTLLYSKEHEWSIINGNIATIGITDYAVEQLGDITFIELPQIGFEAIKDESASFIESVKAASDIYSPLSGKVTEVNEELENSPELLNSNAYKNWIYKIELSNEDEISSLLSEDDYKQYIKTL